MRVDISKWQMENVVRTRRGLRTRKGLRGIKTPTTDTSYVGGFSVEAPSTSEVWHYLFEQDEAGAVDLRVYTEEFYELFTYPLGPMQERPVITHGVSQNQMMINSPSFSVPLYCIVGGGVIAALKSAPQVSDQTAIPIPRGHITTFGDRFAIADGRLLHFNDFGIDPRVFVPSINSISMPGTIYDVMQANGGMLIFTSAGLFEMSDDALNTGQSVIVPPTLLPGIVTARPRNACFSNGRVYVLQAEGVQVLEGPFIDLITFVGRRAFGAAIDRTDLRLSGEIFPTPDGALVAFRGRRGFFCEIDRDGNVSWTTAPSSLNVVGVLRGRTNEKLILLRNRVLLPIGNADDAGEITGVISGKIDVPESKRPLVRQVTTSSANIGKTVGVAVDGTTATATTPTKTGDTIIGTSTWSASEKLRTRQTRTVHHRVFEQTSDAHVQVRVDGGDRPLEDAIDVVTNAAGEKISDGGA